MVLFRFKSNSKYFKSFIYLFLIFFFVNNLLVVKSEENKLNNFYSQNTITFNNHDEFDSQLRMFLGFDSEKSETSYYPDLSLISDSDSIRKMYKLKLNDMTTNKIIYRIKR